jgi:hypothetical protein
MQPISSAHSLLKHIRIFFQIIIFHVEAHPQHKWYQQCVTFNAFPSELHEIAYAAFGMVMMYGLPLVVILFSYASILGEIFRRSRDYTDGESSAFTCCACKSVDT